MSAPITFAEHRANLGLTLAEVAVLLGLRPSSKGWLSEIENGVKPASIRVALRIERWSGGKVPAASLCPELADSLPSRPPVDTPTEPDPADAVALENGGGCQ